MLLAAVPAHAEVRTVGDSGLVTVDRVRCAAPDACALVAPKWVEAKLAGKALRAKLIAPRTIAAGKTATIRARLGGDALRRLAGSSALFKFRLVLRSRGERILKVVVRARLKRRTATRGEGAKKNGDSGPKSGQISAEPPLLARPSSAIDVSDVGVTWYPRDSWLRYAASGVGPGDGILISNGATGVNSTASPCPDRPSISDAQLPYAIDFSPKASWYDPVGGTAGIYGQGSVAFKWAAHTIDLTASDPEIEINGAASRAIFRFNGSGGTPFPNQRSSLVSLDLTGQPAISNGGKTFTYGLMRGTLTEDGVNVFAGFYTPPSNDEFGCVSVSFTMP